MHLLAKEKYSYCINSRYSFIMKLHTNEVSIYLKSIHFGQVFCLRIISERKVHDSYMENVFLVISLVGLVALFGLKAIRKKILETEIWTEGYHLFPPGMCSLSIHISRFSNDLIFNNQH